MKIKTIDSFGIIKEITKPSTPKPQAEPKLQDYIPKTQFERDVANAKLGKVSIQTKGSAGIDEQFESDLDEIRQGSVSEQRKGSGSSPDLSFINALIRK
jgi:hypothetical protein